MMTALLSVGAWAESLWTGSETLAYYGFQLTEAKSMSAGDVLTFTVSETTTGWAGIKLKTNDMTQGYATPGTELISTSAAVGTVKIVVTSEVAAAAAADGLWLDGNDCTVTSVDLEQKQATLNLYSNEEGTTVNYWGSGLSKAMFGAVQTGDLLTVTIKSVGADWGANLSVTTLAGGDGNVELATASISPDELPTTVQITFTDDMVAAAKSDGLYLNGGTYTYTSVDLVYASSGDTEPTEPTDPDATTYGVIMEQNIENGTIVADNLSAAEGTTVTLTITSDAGYQLSKLIIEKTAEPKSANARRRVPAVGSFITATKQNDGTWTFVMPACPVIISATFAQKTLEPTLAYDKATRTVTITNTEYADGNNVTATLYYTLNDGTEQTTTDASVSEVITENTAVKAWIVSTETGNSDNVEETFSVAAKPTVAYTDGENKVSLALTAATATNTADSKLYYTTDGSEPTTGSTLLTADGDIDITEDMTTVKVLALDADGNNSEIVEQSVAYAYSLTASKEWTTYYHNYSKTFSVPAGLKAYTVTSVTAPADGQSGTIEVAEQQVIAPNTPMLIYNEGATTTSYTLSVSNDVISGTPASEFKGVNEAYTIPSDGKARYILVNGVFLLTTGGTLPANRCYLEFGSTSAQARSFSITVGDKTTAIESVGITTQEGEDLWYDLQGCRVMQPQKGIYIRNGKKVVVH